MSRRLPRLRAYQPQPSPGPSRQLVYLDPGTDGYPWTQLVLSSINFPTPGMFWSWNGPYWTPDSIPTIDDVVRAYLGSALMLAERDTELATAKTSEARKLRQGARGLILDSPWNLALFGCQNPNYCGGNDPRFPGATHASLDRHVMGKHGLGIHYWPYHDDVLAALAGGRSPARLIGPSGERLVGVVGRHMPVLWLTPVDLDLLRAELKLQPLKWPDGTSTVLPPPSAQDLAVLDPYHLPGQPSWKSAFGLLGEQD